MNTLKAQNALRHLQADARRIDQEAAVSHMALIKDKPIEPKLASIRLLAQDILDILNELEGQ